MGKPKFSKKKYETPNHPWKETRIKAENELVAKYGLKNKREIWKAETTLRRYRGQARGLLASIGSEDPQAKKEMHQLISHLTRYNILPLNSTLDDVLALNTEIVLSRRLQTLTYLKGFASTPKQARQLINHGHIAIAGRCINVPGYRVTKNEEKDIEYTQASPLNDSAHPARPSGDFVSKMTGGSEPAVSAPIPARKEKDVKSAAGKPTDGKPVEKQKVASDKKNKDAKQVKPLKEASETKGKKPEEKTEKPKNKGSDE
ncbi:30S ribosomal protein S4 [Thermoplasmatales archaeon ex4572_165]|nr:MAG: 30S ribosomal protein S4 [Thermoplasmatales archaeon ex4572_165]